ncbi:unnamed protein product [Caenorhabditis bovis]|uniref:C2 domain-containing protein n=1 Tax=Caenorhabditis bovis TaxID=2654633 RepID=A0A8S1ENX5_9PELO|nr:unnamed protein product [Caenorhabditis bovis]
MRSRKVPLRVEAHERTRSDGIEMPDPFADVQLSRVLKELSFIRIQLDDITLPTPNPFIQKLHNSRQLYGFQLEYSFPCLDVVSKALQSTVRIPEKVATTTQIEFKHKRVVLLTMHEDQVAMWQKSKLNIHLLVQMEAAGKYTTRPLAKASIPLYELLIAPYMICRDFDFVGPDFVGSALIRIDLGSRVKPLMEKLEALRNERSFDETFTVTDRHRNPGRRTRSRSSSRCHSHSKSRRSSDESENLRPQTIELSGIPTRNTRSESSSVSRMPIDSHRHHTRPLSARSSTSTPLYGQHLAASTSSLGSDSVFRPVDVNEYSSVPDRFLKPSNYHSTSEEIRYEGKCHLQLTVHEASGLPPIEDESGRIVSPNAFISILGREGELRSEPIPATRQPRWNWTARFAMSSERRNLVVKVLHRGTMGDKPLGFVTLTLPVASARRAVFEMTDVSRMNKFTSDVPVLVMSIEKVRDIDEDYSPRASAHSSTVSRSHQSTQSSPTIIHRREPPLLNSPKILESREQIVERLRRNMEELTTMVREIQK